MEPDLTISIISADNLDLLLPCLHSVFENTRSSLEVYVVDNASTDNTAATVRAQFPRVRVIRNGTRQGFSTNNNIVLRRGEGRYLLLLNDDTLVLDDALDCIVRFLDRHQEAGAAGSFLLNPDYTFQPAFARFPNPVVEALWPSANWSHHLVRQKMADGRTAPFEVDSVCGASMMVRRQVIEQVGLLDTAFDPIYSEEVDWCYRIKRAGWRIYTVPQARIIHYGGQTMNRVMPRKYELLLSHKLLFFQKHNGPVAANAYRAILGLSTAAKLVGWGLTTLFQPHRQAGIEKRQLHWYLLKRIPYI